MLENFSVLELFVGLMVVFEKALSILYESFSRYIVLLDQLNRILVVLLVRSKYSVLYLLFNYYY